jgi:hypothetical protein
MLARSKATLTYPSCGPGAAAYARAAEEREESVVTASSLDYDGEARRFDTRFRLPSVHDVSFVGKLDQAVLKLTSGRSSRFSLSVLHKVSPRG